MTLWSGIRLSRSGFQCGLCLPLSTELLAVWIFKERINRTIALGMVLAALGQLVGVDIPSFDGHAAGQLLMEGLAILFLRRGMKA